MSVYKYPLYKILIDPESKKTQGLKTGDIARRQYFDHPNLYYSLMIVTDTGIEHVGGKESHYFIGALIEGDEPENGQLLDFVRVTNLFDLDRSGALYLTASDSEAPFMDVIDGLAFENSLSFPAMAGGKPEEPNKNKYSIVGGEYLDISYRSSLQDASRILRVERNDLVLNSSGFIGLKQSIEGEVEHPQRVIVSYKIRGSRSVEKVPVSFGYLSGEEFDGIDTIDITTDWAYKLHLVNVDFPKQYQRCFTVDMGSLLQQSGDWCEVADFNIVIQADIASFADATKARIGKVSGIIDPVFGVLDGYGAYFQNMYATRNVNIAGTLTAGDENGFSSTFYVGKIHKNVILNSIDCEFSNETILKVPESTPVGIGYSWKIHNSADIVVQDAGWRKEHEEKVYCFSFWAKCSEEAVLSVFQDEYHIDDLAVDSNEWKRYYAVFRIKDSESLKMILSLRSSSKNIIFTAPQFENGSNPSQYQPTDGKLSFTEDYGAWFSKGGIGGTIQNPLLRLNDDGSISSRDNSFVINQDGTGHFASGRFKWEKDKITLQDVTIKWEALDEESQDEMKSKSVSLSGANVFHYPDELERSVCEPEEIYVFAKENNFTSVTRKWQYQASDLTWHDLGSKQVDYYLIKPDGHYWEDRNVLSIKYISDYKGKDYSDVFTISKHYDGESAYSVQVFSSQGQIFRNGVVSTTLTAKVYKGGEDISDKIPEGNYLWKRTSERSVEDALWNGKEIRGKQILITGDDVLFKAVFDCEVTLL